MTRQMARRPKSASTLDTHLGYWLRFVSNHVSHAFSRKLAARGITVAEWATMREMLDREPVAPSALAARLGMTRGAISKLSDRLVAKKLAIRTHDGDDRRRQTLALTGTGRTLVPELAHLADRNDAEFFGHLTPAERASLESLMRGIVRRHGLKSVPIQ